MFDAVMKLETQTDDWQTLCMDALRDLPHPLLGRGNPRRHESTSPHMHAFQKLRSLITLGVTTPIFHNQLLHLPPTLMREVLPFQYARRTLLDWACYGECPAPQSLEYVDTLLNFGSMSCSPDHGECSLRYASTYATRYLGTDLNTYALIVVRLINGGALIPRTNITLTISIINSLLRAPKDGLRSRLLHAVFSMTGIDDIIDHSDFTGYTPLGTACLINDKCAVAYLVEKGVKIEKVMHVRSIKMTAVDICWAYHSYHCLQYLLRTSGFICFTNSLTMFIDSEALARRMHDWISAGKEAYRRALLDAHIHGNVHELPEDLALLIVDFII